MLRYVSSSLGFIPKWLDTLAVRRRRDLRVSRPKSNRARLGMEHLEDRLVPSANFLASSYFDSALYEFNATTGAVVKTLIAPYSSTLLAQPAGVALGPDGNIYLSSQTNNSIVEYNVSTKATSTFIPASVLQPIAAANSDTNFNPADLVFGPDGNLYVALNVGYTSTSGGAVIRFNITSGVGGLAYTGSYATVASGLIQPSGLAFGTNAGDTNNLYVGDSGDDQVLKISNATSASPSSSQFINGTTLASPMSFPTGLNWGPDGDLYVVDLGATNPQGNVYKFKPNGSFSAIVTPNSGTGDLISQFPADVAFDGLGNMLTANLGPTYPPALAGSIYQYSLNGSFGKVLVSSSQFASTGPGTSGISPSELVMLPYAPIVTSQPASQTVTAGGSTSFTAAAGGLPTPTVVWEVSTNGGASYNLLSNGVVYSGVTTNTLTITGATAAMNGDKYEAVYTNSSGSATTSAATLTVMFAPNVNSSPANDSVVVGHNASFQAGFGRRQPGGYRALVPKHQWRG